MGESVGIVSSVNFSYSTTFEISENKKIKETCS